MTRRLSWILVAVLLWGGGVRQAHALGLLSLSGTSNTTLTVYYVAGSTANLTSAQFCLPKAGEIDQLTVFCGTALTTGTQTFTLGINGTYTGTPSCAVTSQTCTDHSTAPVNFAAGDLLTLRSVPTGSPSGASACQIGLRVRNQDNSEYDGILLNGLTAATTAVDGDYAGSSGAYLNASAVNGWLMPAGGTFTGICAHTASNVTTNDEKFTAYDATTTTASDLTATVTVGTSTASSTTCTTGCTFANEDSVVSRYNKASAAQNMARTTTITYSGLGQWFGGSTPTLASAITYWRGIGGGLTVESSSEVRAQAQLYVKHLTIRRSGAPTGTTAIDFLTDSTEPASTTGPSLSMTTSDTLLQSTAATVSLPQDNYYTIRTNAFGNALDTQVSVEIVTAADTPTPTPTSTGTPTPTPTPTAIRCNNAGDCPPLNACWTPTPG